MRISADAMRRAPPRSQDTTEKEMSDDKVMIPASTSYVSRVINSDATKKGAAAAIAGVLIAVVTEALWPTNQ